MKKFTLKNEPVDQSIIARYDDESPKAIEFNRLAKNLKRYGNPKEAKSILVTSATKHEGKSLIVSNLGITISKREPDKKILIIDCDLRRPTIHKLFGLKKGPGMGSLLKGKSELSNVAYNTRLENLKVIPSGYDVDSPSQLMTNIGNVLEKCKESFDMIIFDSPPAVPIDDASIIAPYVDGVLLVVLAGKTDRVVVKRAVDILNNVNAKILGVTLNNFHETLPYYYDYSYYRYKYNKERKPNKEENGYE
jgi:capsular exopolysaccharide synthesis family protein